MKELNIIEWEIFDKVQLRVPTFKSPCGAWPLVFSYQDSNSSCAITNLMYKNYLRTDPLQKVSFFCCVFIYLFHEQRWNGRNRFIHKHAYVPKTNFLSSICLKPCPWLLCFNPCKYNTEETFFFLSNSFLLLEINNIACITYYHT